jgi:hypothetical protein
MNYLIGCRLPLRNIMPQTDAGGSQGRAAPAVVTLVRLAPIPMSDKLTPADPRDLADAFAFALRFQGRKRVHDVDEIMAEIVAKRLVEHLERAGFVVMKRPPIGGGAALGRGFEG